MLQGLVDGLSNSEVANRLHLSVNTIKTHVRNIFAKTGSRQRSDAVSWAILRGMQPGRPDA